MDTLARPTLLGLRPELKIFPRLQSQPLAELSSVKGIVNDWLTVTNWVPPVNDAQAHFGLPKGGNRGAPGTGTGKTLEPGSLELGMFWKSNA
jgi:hypothetical protein